MTEKPDYTVEELETMLAAAKAKEEHHEFPRWVEPHESHVVRKAATEDGAPPHISAPAFADIYVGRDGKLSVLVRNEDEEAKALAIAVPYDEEKA